MNLFELRRRCGWQIGAPFYRVFTRPRWKVDCLLRQTVLLHRLVVTLASVQITLNGIHVMNIAMNDATAVERSYDNSSIQP